MQAGVDDTAHAAGLAAGHTEGAMEGILEQVGWPSVAVITLSVSCSLQGLVAIYSLFSVIVHLCVYIANFATHTKYQDK